MKSFALAALLTFPLLAHGADFVKEYANFDLLRHPLMIATKPIIEPEQNV